MSDASGYRTTTLFRLFIAMTPLAAAASLSSPAQISGPGTSLLVPVTLSLGSSDSISGLQFDLQYNNSALSLNTTPGSAVRSSGKDIYFQDLAPNQRRFLIVGINQNPIPDGDVIDLLVGISAAAVGSYQLSIANLVGISPSGSAVPMTATSGVITVQGSSGSRIQASGVLNAASFAAGAVAPGEIITLIGSAIGPSVAQQGGSSGANDVLGGTEVLFDTNPAPLLYAGSNQINAIVPFEISGQATTQISIMTNGELIAGFPVPVSPTSPAIFTTNASGVGPGAILNQDLTINSPSNPADRGSTIVIYGTGAGIMNPQPADGQIMGNNLSIPLLPVSVTIGGLDAQVVYAGSAPGEVAGVLQVNCVVPQNVSSGDSVDVSLTVGSATSPAGALLSVR
jgi:uncharacterized protein (TIGR03437 family)